MVLRDLFFPKTCLGCGFLGSFICLDCQKKINYINKDSCFYCGRFSFFGLTHPPCQRKWGIDGFIAVFYYNNLVKKIIKNVKYRLATEVFKELFSFIEYKNINKLGFYKKIEPDIYLQPVPLHLKKIKERGFNQADCIAEFLSKRLFLPIGHFLERKKNTPAQAQLKKGINRYSNVRGAFAVKKNLSVRGKKLVLVDDVLTTGATIKEATLILKKNGASRVFALALARG